MQLASSSQATETTALEQSAQEFAAGATQLGDNALAAAQNETLAGITPGQAFTQTGIGGGTSKLSSVAAWVGIIGAGLAVLWFLFRKKSA